LAHVRCEVTVSTRRLLTTPNDGYELQAKKKAGSSKLEIFFSYHVASSEKMFGTSVTYSPVT